MTAEVRRVRRGIQWSHSAKIGEGGAVGEKGGWDGRGDIATEMCWRPGRG